MKKRMRAWLSMLMVLAIILSMVPVHVMAIGEEDHEHTATEESLPSELTAAPSEDGKDAEASPEVPAEDGEDAAASSDAPAEDGEDAAASPEAPAEDGAEAAASPGVPAEEETSGPSTELAQEIQDRIDAIVGQYGLAVGMTDEELLQHLEENFDGDDIEETLNEIFAIEEEAAALTEAELDSLQNVELIGHPEKV